MSCGSAGDTRYTYTGNQVGWLNFVGLYNFVAGGTTGLSAGTLVQVFYPNPNNRRPWLNNDAVFNETLLDAAYYTIDLQWFADIQFDENTIFRVSNRAFYVEDENGLPRFYDARCDRAPNISVTVGEWLTPSYEVSDLNISINNRDGAFNKYLPYGDDFRSWPGAKVIVKVGFGEKLSNYMTIFEGQVTTKKGLSTTRDTIEVLSYDKLDNDEVPLPPRVFSSDIYPDIDTERAGAAIPLVYGDWETEEVGDFGAVGAICTNGLDNLATEFIYKVSDVPLQSISEIYLHRGKRNENEPNGPVPITMGAITVDLENGQFTIPKGVDVLDTEIAYNDELTAGAGSGLDLITAKDITVNFVNMKLQVGDKVIKRKTGEIGYIATIAVSQITLTGGVTFALDDEFLILTRKYAFIKGDKLSVKCKGRALNNIFLTRISDFSTDITLPYAMSINFDQTFYLADDDTQKVYVVDFEDGIISELAYADIDPSLASVSSIKSASDNRLWLTDPTTSTVYIYDLDDNALLATHPTTGITGIGVALASLNGIAVLPDNTAWLVDAATGDFYNVDFFSNVTPIVINSYNKSVFEPLATDIQDITYDGPNDQLVVVDKATNSMYRIDQSTGALDSTTVLTALASNVNNVTSVSYAQDGTLFFVDLGTLSIYNYTDASDVDTNPAWIARDLLQKFAGKTYKDFDLSWNFTATQVSNLKCRAAITDKTNLITYINSLLKQYNIVFHLKFQKYSLFWIEFNNFVTNGRLIAEKDIKVNTFRPTKETSQYFNSVTSTYNKKPFNGKSQTSDTYVSPNAIAFAGREVNKALTMPNVYRREDLDMLMPLFVKLAAPDPEFVELTTAFRHIRTQMQDFTTLWFDGDVNCLTGLKESGRRFDHVPCMVRKLSYDLDAMTVSMKLWSLGSTPFPGWDGLGSTVGGYQDPIVLTNIGRLGRIAPIGDITAFTANSVDLAVVSGDDAETRSYPIVGLVWRPNYKVNIVDGATRAILQTLTIDSVSGDTVTFVETITATVVATARNAAGFISGGTYLEYAEYNELTLEQRNFFASYTKPITNYPTSRSQELEEQRNGTHSFDDSGLPYVLYPSNYVSV